MTPEQIKAKAYNYHAVWSFIYKYDKGEAKEMIDDLLYVIECLQEYVDEEGNP